MLRQVNIYVISFLAFSLGVNYCLFPWLDYKIIGLTGDLMSTARTVWGIIQTGLGFLLMVFLLFKNKAIYLQKYWEIIASLVFVMQLPITSLWYMMLMREPLWALSGVIVHTLLIVLIAADYLTSHKSPAKLIKSQPTDEASTKINLDT